MAMKISHGALNRTGRTIRSRYRRTRACAMPWHFISPSGSVVILFLGGPVSFAEVTKLVYVKREHSSVVQNVTTSVDVVRESPAQSSSLHMCSSPAIGHGEGSGEALASLPFTRPLSCPRINPSVALRQSNVHGASPLRLTSGLILH